MTTHTILSTDTSSKISLFFDSLALERCFQVADILHRRFAQPFAEYGLLGLSTEERPLHVEKTLLLPGQRVTAASVQQSGHHVLRMRSEISRMSASIQRRLVPIVFIHRHLNSCSASETDDTFLRGVFVDQVSTLVSFDIEPGIDSCGPPCACPKLEQLTQDNLRESRPSVSARGECAFAFSLIVNREREHRLYAVCKHTCPSCHRSETREIPAHLVPTRSEQLSPAGRAAIHRELEQEIRRKITFECGTGQPPEDA